MFENPDAGLIRVMLELKRDVASLRRVVLPQRDVVGRLARREFPEISEAVAYRFRDVYDHLVRLTDEAIYFQDRISGLLEANLVEREQPPEPGDEGADADRDHFHADDGDHRHLGHERRPAAITGRPSPPSSGG